MSHAITDLHLEALPVTIERLGVNTAPLWRGTCDCTYATVGHRLLSQVLREMTWHAAIHNAWAREGAA